MRSCAREVLARRFVKRRLNIISVLLGLVLLVLIHSEAASSSSAGSAPPAFSLFADIFSLFSSLSSLFLSLFLSDVESTSWILSQKVDTF